ncbi:MAG: bacillithiol biosynthesis cysteine-adding enzyme BshC [Lutibacter sp.]
MQFKRLPYQNTGYFSKIINDYLDKKPELQSFYNHFPNLDGFKKQLEIKSALFQTKSRNILVNTLKNQHKNCDKSDLLTQNLELLKQENTFTITTGHQLNIFTGPLYFLYKIVSAINLSNKLKETYPNYNFVPVYWMATEDHDFEEINYFNFKGNKIKWNKESSGAVGRLSTEDFDKVYQEFADLLGKSNNAAYLKELFEKSYLSHNNLTDATRYLVNELFGEYGLVILDGNNTSLKKQFIPIIKEELLHQTSFKEVSKTNEQLQKLSYKIQVNPREINLFYLKDKLRERIIFENHLFKINNTNISFTEDEILTELNNHPERFSPNVLLRGLYQEIILPNLCYIGGGGELAYWFQLKQYFKAVNVPFPILLLRNSALWMSKKQLKKIHKLGLKEEDLFLNQSDLNKKFIRSKTDLKIDFSEQKLHLVNQFKHLKNIAKKTDPSFIGAVLAQERKQIKGLEKLEKRLLKAEKNKYQDWVNRLVLLQNELFPNQNLEERIRNFSEVYLQLGEQLIPTLVKKLNPLELKFTILYYE